MYDFRWYGNKSSLISAVFRGDYFLPSRLNTRKLPIITSPEIAKIIRVAMALISGETPNRIFEKIIDLS